MSLVNAIVDGLMYGFFGTPTPYIPNSMPRKVKKMSTTLSRKELEKKAAEMPASVKEELKKVVEVKYDAITQRFSATVDGKTQHAKRRRDLLRRLHAKGLATRYDTLIHGGK